MRKDIFYKFVIGLLVLLNVAAVGFIWMQGRTDRHEPPQGGRWNHVDRIILDKLHLDEQQQNQFEQLKNEHHRQMVAIQKDAGELHNELFKLLQAEPVDTAKRNEVIANLQVKEKEKEALTFDHFKKLRAILRADQKKGFDDFVDELGRHLLSGPPPGEMPGEGPNEKPGRP